MIAEQETYLMPVVEELVKVWPDNRTVNIVCHGHSIPCGYTVNHRVDSLSAYPNLLRMALQERFPCAVQNVIVTAIGGECAVAGARRFTQDVLPHKPEVLVLDYAGNDRFQNFHDTQAAWRKMIENSLEMGIKVLALTSFPDCGKVYYNPESLCTSIDEINHMIRSLCAEYEIGLADIAQIADQKMQQGHKPIDYLSSVVHPNAAGHKLIADEIIRWFPLLI